MAKQCFKPSLVMSRMRGGRIWKVIRRQVAVSLSNDMPNGTAKRGKITNPHQHQIPTLYLERILTIGCVEGLAATQPSPYTAGAIDSVASCPGSPVPTQQWRNSWAENAAGAANKIPEKMQKER